MNDRTVVKRLPEYIGSEWSSPTLTDRLEPVLGRRRAWRATNPRIRIRMKRFGPRGTPVCRIDPRTIIQNRIILEIDRRMNQAAAAVSYLLDKGIYQQ